MDELERIVIMQYLGKDAWEDVPVRQFIMNNMWNQAEGMARQAGRVLLDGTDFWEQRFMILLDQPEFPEYPTFPVEVAEGEEWEIAHIRLVVGTAPDGSSTSPSGQSLPPHSSGDSTASGSGRTSRPRIPGTTPASSTSSKSEGRPSSTSPPPGSSGRDCACNNPSRATLRPGSPYPVFPVQQDGGPPQALREPE